MSKLVITSKNPNLKVGKIYRGLDKGPWHRSEPNQCFFIVAKSTEQAWIDCLVSFHGEKERSFLEMLAVVNGPWYYYEIETD